MIGIIVTGHGHFASGMTSSLNLITGEHKDYFAVDFDGVISPDELLAKINEKIEKLSNCDAIYVFTDLQGGTPFRMAATATLSYENVHVFSGTNLPMLVECVMSRDFQDDPVAFVDQLVESTRMQVSKFARVQKREEESEEDGI